MMTAVPASTPCNYSNNNNNNNNNNNVSYLITRHDDGLGGEGDAGLAVHDEVHVGRVDLGMRPDDGRVVDMKHLQ